MAGFFTWNWGQLIGFHSLDVQIWTRSTRVRWWNSVGIVLIWHSVFCDGSAHFAQFDVDVWYTDVITGGLVDTAKVRILEHILTDSSWYNSGKILLFFQNLQAPKF